jgi:hypothetical protein
VRLCCPHRHQYYIPLRLPTRHRHGLRSNGLISPLPQAVCRDPVRSPLFHRGLSPHSAPHTPEGSSRLHFQSLHLFHGLREHTDAQLPLAPLAGLTYRRCRIPFMVWTTRLRSLRGSILRFTTVGHPAAMADSYVALWRLPRPDFHRRVICSFRAHAFDVMPCGFSILARGAIYLDNTLSLNS